MVRAHRSRAARARRARRAARRRRRRPIGRERALSRDHEALALFADVALNHRECSVVAALAPGGAAAAGSVAKDVDDALAAMLADAHSWDARGAELIQRQLLLLVDLPRLLPRAATRTSARRCA